MNETNKDPALRQDSALEQDNAQGQNSALGQGLPTLPQHRYWPLLQLTIARVREFYREPQAIFWVYAFPLLMAIALGVAFRDKPVEKILVDVVKGDGADKLEEQLRNKLEEQLHNDPKKRFKVEIKSAEEAANRLERGETEVVIAPSGSSGNPHYEYTFDKNRIESENACHAVDSFLLRAAKGDELDAHPLPERSGSYITFLIPGLIGMNLMGGGLWGAGFATVDLRVRKLLKRMVATPMRRSDFLLSIALSRLLFSVSEIVLLVVFARLVFGVEAKGSLAALSAVVALGAMSFMGLGLLVACRAQTMEAVSGLMNLVMLPMYLVSGVFFSSTHFPKVVQPVITALPLTALNDALRAVMTDGKPLWDKWLELLIVTGWGVVSFVLALRWFRWT
jgi:ABC-type polysaccharide/polyol phosphate export permease